MKNPYSVNPTASPKASSPVRGEISKMKKKIKWYSSESMIQAVHFLPV